MSRRRLILAWTMIVDAVLVLVWYWHSLPTDWKSRHEIAGTIQNFISSAAIIVGAGWAYFKFVRFRTLRPRLEFKFDFGRSEVDDSHALLILRLYLTNKGQTKVELRKAEHPRCFLKYALIPEAGSAAPVALLTIPPHRLKHLDAAFRPHRWVEPGETIDDVKVLKINKARSIAVQVELVLFGLHKWSASAAVPLIGHPESKSFESEDEQDDYDEAEALQEGLQNALARIRFLVQSEDRQSIMEEIEALLRESNVTKKFASKAEHLVTRAERLLSATG
jgi:hypothetical protein